MPFEVIHGLHHDNRTERKYVKDLEEIWKIMYIGSVEEEILRRKPLGRICRVDADQAKKVFDLYMTMPLEDVADHFDLSRNRVRYLIQWYRTRPQTRNMEKTHE